MKKLLLALAISAISITAMADARPAYNCSNTQELDREIVILAAIYDSSNNSVVQNAVRNELRFHEVLREDLQQMCSNVYKYHNRTRVKVETTYTIEEWFEDQE
jgi:hypothetical protein